jgi:transposase
MVADPGFAAMYATRSKRVKTDKRDARALCEALQLGAYRAVHRASDAQRHLRAQLAVRDALVRTRTRYIAIIKAAVRREGLRVPSGEAEQTVAKLAALPLAPAVRAELAPLVALLAPLQAELTAADAHLTAIARTHQVVTRLATMPSVGPITALAFVAALDDVTRFHSAHQVQAYLGLVPSEYSSGNRRARGHITKRAMRGCAGSWSRRRGASCAHRTRRWRGSRHGRSPSHSGVASGSRPWPWRAAWPVSSTRCSATTRRFTRRQRRPRCGTPPSEHAVRGLERVDDPEMTDLGRGERDAADGRS